MLLPGEIVVDNFAGGGGASTGMEMGLNRHVDVAINHDPPAIDMHKMNHPETKHYCESVWDVDPVEACAGRPVGLAWFSPDCKHFSKAKGGRPVDKNIRGLAWVTIRWAALVPVRILMLENVEEFMSWGPCVEVSPGKFKPCPERSGETFDAFIKVLTTGLNPEHPAWPEIYDALGDHFPYHMIESGLGYEVEFRTLSACDYGAPTTRKRFFMIARNDGAPIQWPEPTHGPEGSGLQPYRTAADIIDWSIPVKSIFGRKRPLAENTMKRIAKGIQKFVVEAENPFVVPEAANIPFITEHANASSQRNMPADEPLRTICAQVKGGHFAVVTSSMIKLRGSNIGHGTDEPVHTISAGGNHIGELRAFLIKYYGTNYGHAMNEPVQTITTKHRFGLVTILGEDYQIVDIGMRMLEPHELFAAQGFPEGYQISHSSTGKKLSKASQVARCGNAVCPPVAQALVEANIGSNQLNEIAA
ncbi:DNA cytosine methyltransferase [Photobacterium sp. TY1-4]|uniref:DNA cytosine methyltransferase n=1 Tax=Photobacterium sp. TY1-4 TaxID=2899122 RepID=UPI0021C01400|nr:DNA cytosine methyltransferase [Photobacterium sp. TY1-4]UXI00450.1 DNA cytosine methyltransferase [Photobacterium sp. TY1-4]